jgi:hypothetical protein
VMGDGFGSGVLVEGRGVVDDVYCSCCWYGVMGSLEGQCGELILRLVWCTISYFLL